MIFIQLSQQLQSLSDLLLSLHDEQYNHKIGHLGNASIGGHTRHIIELLQCAVNGYKSGEVDYFNRHRNLDLETNRLLAQSTLQQLQKGIKFPDKQLKLFTVKSDDSDYATVTTSYFREIVYNTEHAIHHLALIKVALLEMNLNIVDENFGMAYSTIKYKASLSNA
ncbi:hypothetical protein GALL_46380 [mine drainage metagenome]|uniref:DinB family protein n=1 Tax=mine drainage metagenome TaxID=410659 RepID=A0A1J5T012_9ZZZZ